MMAKKRMIMKYPCSNHSVIIIVLIKWRDLLLFSKYIISWSVQTCSEINLLFNSRKTLVSKDLDILFRFPNVRSPLKEKMHTIYASLAGADKRSRAMGAKVGCNIFWVRQNESTPWMPKYCTNDELNSIWYSMSHAVGIACWPCCLEISATPLRLVASCLHIFSQLSQTCLK